MYKNGKMRYVETLTRIEGGGINENGEGEFKYDIFDTLLELL
jgi:hypothetical protein